MHDFPRSHQARNLWLIRLLAILALSIIGFLIYQKLTGQISSIVGCGGAGGCAQILGGYWSQWFGIPVTFFAAGLYLGALILTTPMAIESNSRFAYGALKSAAMLALLAAVWFLGLMFFAEKSFCPYCVAIHVLGIAFGIVTLNVTGKNDRRSNFETSMSVSFWAFVALAAGQIFGPQPDTHEIANLETDPTINSQSTVLENEVSDLPATEHRETAGSKTGPDETEPIEPGDRGTQRDESAHTRASTTLIAKASFIDGKIVYDVMKTPRIGNPSAKLVVAEFFDYTCENCRKMHSYMHRLEAQHPDQFLVLILPCPLNDQCNPFFGGDSAKHANACEYARLALACWRVAPDRFEEFHDYMMTGEPVPPLEDARRKAIQLAGADALKAVEDDPWIEKLLKQTYEHYYTLASQNHLMPKLLLGGNAILNGLAIDSERFVEAISTHFELPDSPKQ